jgi:hypothetical protein
VPPPTSDPRQGPTFGHAKDGGRQASRGDGTTVGAGPTATRAGGAIRGAQPAGTPHYQGGIEALVSGVVSQGGATVKPAAIIATTFGFPLILMLAVLFFLLIQSRMDDRDPKLRVAPLTVAEMVLPFRDEEQL